MKYLLVIAVALIGWFVWRQQRRGEREASRERSTHARKAKQPQAMVRCPVCALHLPEADAIAGQRGRYCSEAHRAQAEG